MNTNSNIYTIVYAAVMVVVVALGLSFTHQALNERQTKNVQIDKMQQILRSLKMDIAADEAEDTYSKLISDAYLIETETGEKDESSVGAKPTDPAFMTNVSAGEGFPVYEAEIDGDKKYILPLDGKGLWGPIWGYIAVNSDGKTVYGVEFGHDSETPGLGAEITHLPFRKQFEGKELFKDGEFKSIAVVKKGKTISDKDYVDAISGGTITSQGVDAMIYDSLENYKNFLANLPSSN